MVLKDVDIQVKVKSVDVVRRELDRIKKENEEGLLTAEAVLDNARHPDAELHGFFEWDDSVGGEQWRLVQARMLIRWVKVSTPDGENGEAVQKYVSLFPDRKRDGGGYRETSEVVSNPELLRELEETAKKELESWLRRHSLLKSLCEAVRKAAGVTTARARRRRSGLRKAGQDSA